MFKKNDYLINLYFGVNMNIQKPFRVSLKLKEGKSPHIYLTQLKVLMEEDTSLHPMMYKTLQLLKKTRTPFIMLATLREIVIDPLNFRHFDRSAEPRGDWVCTLWSKEEIKEHKQDAEGHIKAMFKMFEALGYEFYDSKECSQEYIRMLEDLTSKQIENQMLQREGME
ncbi:MAG: hypothetical protein M0R17_09410 [Candidatus Omnitrophica bacterium]|jgi:hypothetical protein|nr:hypothetical protein [Candidatus Omnitrophota bacterium]